MKVGRPDHCKGCVNFFRRDHSLFSSNVGKDRRDPAWCCAKGDVVHRSIGWCITIGAKVNANTGK